MDYRSEIDGLRAIAVLAVILAHSGLGIVIGGFAGVDVFFVISGFLITRILLDDLQAGRWSYRRFYARRAQRILPALFVVLAVTAPISWAMMTPSQFQEYALSLSATVIFLSNAYFWDLTGYFSPDALELPLLHTWSLAVEEQFYLLFPPILYLAWRQGGVRAAAVAVALMTLASFALSEWGARNEPRVNYFFSFSRFWEILVGALAAFAERRWPPRGCDWRAGLGAVMIGVAFLGFDETTPFPSAYTALPVLGAALILRYARGGLLVARALSVRPLVAVGLVSYSAYLWHQPVFAFARLEGITVAAPATAALLIGLTLVLAWASWRYVETPWRRRGKASAPAGIKALAPLRVALLSAGLLFAAGIAGFAGNLGMLCYAEADRPLVSVSRKDASSYLHRLGQSVEGREFAGDGRRRVLVIGDSFGKDIINTIAAAGDGEVELSFHEIPWPCGNLFLRPGEVEFPPHPLPPMCRGLDRYASDALMARVAAAEVVVLASDWQAWQVPYLTASLANLRGAVSGEIVIFGTKSFGHFRISDLLDTPAGERPGLRLATDGGAAEINAAMRTLEIAGFVDLVELICDGGQACPPVAADGRLHTLDGRHLTVAGAAFLSRLLIERSPEFRRILG